MRVGAKLESACEQRSLVADVVHGVGGELDEGLVDPLALSLECPFALLEAEHPPGREEHPAAPDLATADHDLVSVG